MGANQSGPRNGFWKGGRTVASNGYVLIRVGVEHHLADVRGYAYEHRIVAEQKIGRRLMRGEQVHHVNGIKTDNRPENLEVMADQAAHYFHHRKPGCNLQNPSESNEIIECACGCGSELLRFDDHGRPRSYVSGHNPPDSPVQDAIVAAVRQGVCRVSDIIRFVGASKASVFRSLNRLSGRGLVRKVARGTWEAADGR